MSQVSLLLNQIFASFLPTGSVSWLYYADRLMELPAGVLGVAVGTILLPSLSKYHAAANPAEYSRLLDWGLRITVLLARAGGGGAGGARAAAGRDAVPLRPLQPSRTPG